MLNGIPTRPAGIKKFALPIEILGLMIVLAGFFANRAAQFPFVARLIAGEYVAAKDGSERLFRTGKLVGDDVGFDILVRLLKLQLITKYPADRIERAQVIAFEYKPGVISFGDAMGSTGPDPVTVRFANGQAPTWLRSSMERSVSDLLQAATIRPSILLLILGLSVNIFGLVVKYNTPTPRVEATSISGGHTTEVADEANDRKRQPNSGSDNEPSDKSGTPNSGPGESAPGIS